jgi:hypothetical protein
VEVDDRRRVHEMPADAGRVKGNLEERHPNSTAVGNIRPAGARHERTKQPPVSTIVVWVGGRLDDLPGESVLGPWHRREWPWRHVPIAVQSNVRPGKRSRGIEHAAAHASGQASMGALSSAVLHAFLGSAAAKCWVGGSGYG